MIKSKFLIVSKDISLDAFTKTLSLFTLVENLNTEQVPFIIPKLMATTFIERTDLSKEEHPMIKIILKNNTTILQEKEQEVDFKWKLGHKRINGFNNIKIEEFGELIFSLEYNGEEINRWTITINQVQTQTE